MRCIAQGGCAIVHMLWINNVLNISQVEMVTTSFYASFTHWCLSFLFTNTQIQIQKYTNSLEQS